MAKKPPKPVSHTGKRSWWDGSLMTTCGTRYESGEHRAVGWLESHTRCPSCEAGKKHKHK